MIHFKTKKDMNAREYLLKHGIRPSTQRVAVMQFLLDNLTHPTVEQIYAALLPGMPTLSKTTVYNTLKILESKGAIVCIDIDHACERYDADTSIHGHSLCRRCGAVSDVMLKDSRFAGKNSPSGMQVDSIQLLYKGLCLECSGNADTAAS